MKRELVLLSGVGAGAALMYMLDPDRGTRRRALVRDKAVSLAHKTPDALNAMARDLSNRARGLVSEASTMLRGDDASDEVIVQRVRAAMGRVVSHPHAVRVESNEGRVSLSGNILADEVDDFLSCAGSVRGVREVDNRLTVHEETDGVPDLQGGRARPGYRFEFMQENWSPTARLVACVAGGALTAYALRQKFPVACVLGTVGLGLVARGTTNTGLMNLLSADAITSLFAPDGDSATNEADGEPTGATTTPSASASSAPQPGANENRNEPTASINPPRARGASAR
jgi:osmotically-inducible protein OsmY